MNIYKPTEVEVMSMMRRSLEKLPQMKEQWQKAVQLLLEESLWWSNKTWKCTSQSNPAHAYNVNFTSCTCEDFATHAQVVHEKAYCKHKLTLLAYRELMAVHIKNRFAGDAEDSSSRRRARAFAKSLLLGSVTPDGRPIIEAYADHRDKIPTVICAVTYKLRGILPKTESDLYKFARWLAEAEPEPRYHYSTFCAAPDGWDALAAEGFVLNHGVWQYEGGIR